MLEPYRTEVVMGEDDKAVKATKADGTPTRINLTQRVTYVNAADVPGSLCLGKTGFERLSDRAPSWPARP